MVSKSINPFNVLHVTPRTPLHKIKVAYYNLARKHHPDMNTHVNGKNDQKMKEINEAWSIISDPDKLQEYLDSLNTFDEDSLPRSNELEFLFSLDAFYRLGSTDIILKKGLEKWRKNEDVAVGEDVADRFLQYLDKLTIKYLPVAQSYDSYQVPRSRL
jgi:curved DNA-binding protein CbpA